jgi:drug/metabolite transporter (DMT)-like permease
MDRRHHAFNFHYFVWICLLRAFAYLCKDGLSGWFFRQGGHWRPKSGWVQWSQFSFMGIVFGLLAAICYGLYITLSAKVAVDVHPISRSVIIVFVSMSVVLSVFPPTFIGNGILLDGLWLWALLLSFFGVVIPPICYTIGVPKTGGGLASIFSSIELSVAVLMSGLVLQEKVTVLQWVGVTAIIIGIALPEFIARRLRVKVLRQERSESSGA